MLQLDGEGGVASSCWSWEVVTDIFVREAGKDEGQSGCGVSRAIRGPK